MEDDDEESLYHDCPKCSRAYDEIDYEFQICSKCGWNEGEQKYKKARRPTKEDYLNGDADILTEQWI